MNVTLTRARQNLWVVGSRATLARNDLWAKFLDYIGEPRIVHVPRVSPGTLSPYFVPEIASVTSLPAALADLGDEAEPELEEID